MNESKFYFKSRIPLLIFFGILSLVGLILFISALEEEDYLFESIVILTTGVVGFGILLKTASGKPGLILSDEGIMNNTILGAGSYNINWHNVKTIQVRKIKSKYAILLFLNNSEELINKQRGLLKSEMQNKMKKYGTPALIMHTILKDSSTILRLFEKKLDEINPGWDKEN